MNPSDFLVIDGTALLFRMYFSPGSHLSLDGVEVGGVVGVTRALVNLVREHKPRYVAIVFDAGQRTFRNDMFEAYKQNRGAPPEDLIPQFDLVVEATEALGFQTFKQVGFEADDLVATFSRLAMEQGISVTLVTDDKDITGLIQDGDCSVSQWLYSKKKRLNEADVVEKYGIQSSQMVDYLAMIGDASDNIPGIKGVGPKTASQLLQHFGTLEEVIENVEQITTIGIRGAKSVAQKVTLGAETALQAKRLIQLVNTVPISCSEIQTLTLSAPTSEAKTLFTRLRAEYILSRHQRTLEELEGLV
jgi:DNA polymerase-1